MKKLFWKMLFLTMLLTMCFGMSVLASEVDTTIDEPTLVSSSTPYYDTVYEVGTQRGYQFNLSMYGVWITYSYTDGVSSRILDGDLSSYNVMMGIPGYSFSEGNFSCTRYIRDNYIEFRFWGANGITMIVTYYVDEYGDFTRTFVIYS